MKRTHVLLFFIVFAAIAILYNYHQILFLGPQSAHHWRQADCASVAMNYYQNGMNFFKPQLHNVLGGEGYAVGEFPIIYYFVAILYKIFGPHEFYFRLVSTLIFASGLFALFSIVFRLTKDLLLSGCIALLFFASPVMVFYGNNFLPDVSSFSFTLIAWNFFHKFYYDQRLKTLYISMFFFLLAGLIKITALISLGGILAIYMIEFDNWYAFGKNRKLFTRKWKMAIPMVLVLVINGLWYWWAMRYNSLHNTNYFSTKTWPLWDLNPNDVVYVFYRTFLFWSKDFFHPVTLYFLVFLTFFILFRNKKQPALLYTVSLVCFIAVLLFFQLWGYAFIDHDYYIINLNIYVVFLLLTALMVLKTDFSQVYRSWVFRVACVLFLVFNVYHTRKMLRVRYKPDSSFRFAINPAFSEPGFKDFLKTKGIQYPDKVVSYPDVSPNVTLYQMNLKGWTELYAPAEGSNVAAFKQYGAKYLVISDTAYLSKETLKPYFNTPVGNYKNIHIFKL